MRFSPYDMSDYGLQHRGGAINPIQMTPYDEAAWNLYWASIPEIDRLLDLPYEDFDGFKAIGRDFPFTAKVQSDNVLRGLAGLRFVLGEAEPKIVLAALQAHRQDLRLILGAAAAGWLATVESRLNWAQSLVDVKEAAAVCESVIAVDFKAGRRL